MKKIFYEKVGRRYKPVREYDSELLDAMPKGAHIIMSYPGGKSARYCIEPALAPMIAAGRYAENAISGAIVNASSMRPSKTVVTQEQKEAWENLARAFGDEIHSLRWDSVRDITLAGVRAMEEEADKLLKNPAVQKAYDHFMLMCKLAKEENND